MIQHSVQKYYAALTEAQLLANDVVKLTFELPKRFRYEAGQYIMIRWKDEWHPFTLTSSPEDSYLSVHIRSPNSHDWCSALRRHVIEEAPKAAGIEPTKGTDASIVVHYEKARLGRTFFCKPTKPPARAAKASGRDASEVDVALASSLREEKKHELPPEALALKLNGPHGAPAQKVWHFQTIMVVGSGIGITPFISVLRSAMLRAQQRKAIWEKDRGFYSAEVLDRILPVPKRIHFYWIVRGQAEFNWFRTLLVSSGQGLAKDMMNINLFTTGKVDGDGIKAMSQFGNHQHREGRPEWATIFKAISQQHTGEHVGVFLCGAPAIGAELRRQCAAHTVEGNGEAAPCTRFSFYSEHF